MTYDICFLRSEAYQTDFFVILGHFLLFYHTNNPKSQNFEKIKKMPGIIILCKCTKNHDHMLYWFWDMACEGCNFYFSFFGCFLPFYPSRTRDRPRDIIILHMCTKNYDQMMYGSCNIVCDGRTERWTEKVTYRGGCPTKVLCIR